MIIPRFQIVPCFIHVSNNDMLRLSVSSCDGLESVGPRVACFVASPTPRRRNQRAELKITPSTLIMVNRKLIHPWMLKL